MYIAAALAFAGMLCAMALPSRRRAKAATRTQLQPQEVAQ
jgi:hypothetical protein